MLKRGLDEIGDISNKIKEMLPSGGVVLLVGDLASGKTTLVKDFVKSLGLDTQVDSPTFSVMNIYDDKIYHYDIYNEGTAKFIESGLLENLSKDGYHFIEWADERLQEILKAYEIEYIKIEILSVDDKREYNFVA